MTDYTAQGFLDALDAIQDWPIPILPLPAPAPTPVPPPKRKTEERVVVLVENAEKIEELKKVVGV